MRVRTAMTATLDKGQVLGVLDHAGKFADRLGQQMGIVRHLHSLRNLWLLLIMKEMRLRNGKIPIKWLKRIKLLLTSSGNIFS